MSWRYAMPSPSPMLGRARARRAALGLAGEVQQISFWRPRWHYALAGFPGAFLAVLLLSHVRVRWNAEHVVIEKWPERTGVKTARTDVRVVRSVAGELLIDLAGDRSLPLVVGRAVNETDRARAAELARALGAPFVDDRPGGGTGLPRARVVR